jgi:hypothetical protein
VVATMVEVVAVPSIGSSSPCSPGSLLVGAGSSKHATDLREGQGDRATVGRYVAGSVLTPALPTT